VEIEICDSANTKMSCERKFTIFSTILYQSIP
jgi:hypothetical protein